MPYGKIYIIINCTIIWLVSLKNVEISFNSFTECEPNHLLMPNQTVWNIIYWLIIWLIIIRCIMYIICVTVQSIGTYLNIDMVATINLRLGPLWTHVWPLLSCFRAIVIFLIAQLEINFKLLCSKQFILLKCLLSV